ncbi:hypothetical protein KUTeg_019552 [Tegillarca granosa]|uniref:Uncharacterized protein n=1 Tax=Tegillarca granosa TaxID=220873 RepID=A0ABQ9ECS2_TEGGR|nr:hypothetical protein KUTeg_019552 [Tegillarca granosa]
MFYPITVYTDQLTQDSVDTHQELARLGENREWDTLIERLAVSKSTVNMVELPVKNESPTCSCTPLHYAAEGDAPKKVFERMLHFGALKCLKTSNGETAFDIGKRKGLDQDILELIKVPDEVQQNERQIQAMELGLHEVMKYTVGDLFEETGQVLPQVAVLYENDINKFFFPVPGMYGGFRIRKVRKGIQVDSFVRICGGSEMRHLIERSDEIQQNEKQIEAMEAGLHEVMKDTVGNLFEETGQV